MYDYIMLFKLFNKYMVRVLSYCVGMTIFIPGGSGIPSNAQHLLLAP